MPDRPPLRLLVVEDNENDALLIVRELRKDYAVEFMRVDTPEGFVLALAAQEWDVITCDYTMPHFSAPAALVLLRQSGVDLPFISVSGTIGEEAAVELMRAGAADYLMKDRLTRLSLAVQQAIEKAAQRRSEKDAFRQALEGWARALELKDKETEGHSQRVMAMTVELARLLGIPEAELEQIGYGALLHDIGKIGVPDAILHKPGPLDEDEWKIMRMHPLWGCELLKPIAFLKEALEIPCDHHERWDGSGYPRGLKGEAIPLSARIFALSDLWDACTNDRPYRVAMSEDAALSVVRAERGKTLDPQVVDAFLTLKEAGLL